MRLFASARLAARLITGMCLAALLGLAATGASHAGTAAWVITTTPMVAGPGTAYDAVGTAPAETPVDVTRCSGLWCKIAFASTSGWVSRDKLSFGTEPRAALTGPHFDRKSGGGTVCFYTGPDFSGSTLCRPSGFVVKDLALVGMDNIFSSVSVEGAASVLVCREMNFASYCETLTGDTPRLNRYLYKNVTSLHIF